MEPFGAADRRTVVNREMESWHRLPVEEDPGQVLGQTSALVEDCLTLNPDGQTGVIGDSGLLQAADRFESLHLELQDSCLSPALTLIPQGKAFLSESTLLHQTDLEFFPLRGSPDVSVASERCPQMSRLVVDGEADQTSRSNEQASLLHHHHVGGMSAIIEDVSSCCSLSQHSLSPSSNYQATQYHDEEHSRSLENNDNWPKEKEEQTDADLDTRETLCDLSRRIPVFSFQNHLEMDLGVASRSTVPSSTAAVFSQTDVALSSTDIPKQSLLAQKQDPACTSIKEPEFRPYERTDQPEGGSASLLSQRKTVSLSSHLSAISTACATRKETPDTTDLHLRQLQSHCDSSLSAPGVRIQPENKNTPIASREGGIHSTGLQRALYSSGSHKATDGSFLSSQPVFQSTPAVLCGREAAAPAELSPVYSHQDTTSNQNSSPKSDNISALTLSASSNPSAPGVALATAEAHSQEASSLNVPVVTCKDAPHIQPTSGTLLPTSDNQLKNQKPKFSVARVHSLPSLSFLQKVDAWKANQSSSRLFYDNLSLQEFDCVPLKSKEHDSEAINQQSPQQSNKSASVFSANNSTLLTQTGTGLMPCADVEEEDGAVRSTSPSRFTHSHSQSSLRTVITPIQQDELQQTINQLPHVGTDAISASFQSPAAESLLSSSGTNDQQPSNNPVTHPLKNFALLSGDQYSCMNKNTNRCNMVSSFSAGFHAEQNFQASLGASSFVSLEVDNYAPYWMSRPESLAPSSEFNIEERIPVYLHNLGIDQSPSTILNPFTLRGPIREPEFSPTDLCTIKGSVGTPTKSIQPSDGDSLQKETLSSSSVLSSDSNSSLTQSVVQPIRPASSGSVTMTHLQTTITSSELHIPPYNVSQGDDTSRCEGSSGLPAQVCLNSVPGTWEGVKEGDSSLVGSGTLQEIRRLLGHAESLASGHFSVTSSPGSHCYPESDASFLSPRQNTQTYNDDSFLSVDREISLVLAHSSSDSALKESSSSSSEPLETSTNSDHMSKGPSEPSGCKEENLKSHGFHVTPRRAEPEGCSAADPDKAGPVIISITQGNKSSALDAQQQIQGHMENAGTSSSEASPTHSQTEAEMGVLNGASSEYSLSSRVAKLLQSESSVSMVTSPSSTADPDESQAGEWNMKKLCGGKSDVFKLNSEDRMRIEEIKRDLLLHTKHTKISDSESSSQSSTGTVPQPAICFAAVCSAQDSLSEQLSRVSQISLNTNTAFHKPVGQGLGQIPIKEGCDLHIHNGHAVHNDGELESNSYPTPRSSDKWRLQIQMTNGSTKTETGNERVEKKNELRVENEHAELLAVSEEAHTVIRGTRDFTPDLESASVMSHNHPIPSVELQQTSIQRHNIPPSACRELVSGFTAHHPNSPYSSEDPLPVSNTCKQQQASIDTQTSLSKDRNADQYQNTRMVNGNSQMTSRHMGDRQATSNVPLLLSTAVISTLLPYKPHGSSELFYMPQSVPEFSPNHSDSAVESSHPGSDDAVPPKFTAEVLGNRELVDNYVMPKHKEGIYSKRAKMNQASNLSAIGNSGPPGQFTIFSEPGVPANKQVVEQMEEDEEAVFIPLQADNSTAERHPICSALKRNSGAERLPLLSKAIREEERDPMVQNLDVEISNSLDQLWRQFSEQYSLQETQPRSDVEMSLLERLERLSRLLHSSSSPHTSNQAHRTAEKKKSRRRENEKRIKQGKHTTIKGTEKERTTPNAAWEKKSSSTNQKEDLQNQDYPCPAVRGESACVSVETSSYQSTIDTPRLIRAFGPHRVRSGREGVSGSQTLIANDSLLKLHNTIRKQKKGHNKLGSEKHLISVSTEASMASDTLSTSSTYTLHSQRDTSSKTANVKLVSRSIQAGDLEIVVNGTRRDTRDVGTTFPSPASARVTRASSGACCEVKAKMYTLRAPSVSPVQIQPVPRRRVLSKRSCHLNGLSWFVSADELKWGTRKENKPQTDAGKSGAHAWFETYTRIQPWREPLRERHIQVEKEKPPGQETHSEDDHIRKSPILVPLTLQEALAVRRPEFVSRSRERMKRLCLLTEERKIQAIFGKEREELFNPPSTVQQPKAAPPPLPSKRVIPINEMIQRSKRGEYTRRIGKTERFSRVYAQLPEVQKRKEEEKRKAEYYTYRLNAQLFNKKITNRVLGRRTPWQ